MTTFSKRYKYGRQESSFDAVDFLKEGLEEFLESGDNIQRLASCIVKVAIATELLIKDKLQDICPALVLEKLDDRGLQLVKLYNLQDKLIDANTAKGIEIRTAPFPVLLKRAENFLKIKPMANHLRRLQEIRNGLIHHTVEIDVWEVNLLLTKHIFPFLRRLLKGDFRASFLEKEGVWKALKQIERKSVNTLHGELLKKCAHHLKLVQSFSRSKIDALLGGGVHKDEAEVVYINNLPCPACNNRSLALLLGLDVDWNPDGVLEDVYRVLRCRVCELELNEDEIDCVTDNFEDFFEDGNQKEEWIQALSRDAPRLKLP